VLLSWHISYSIVCALLALLFTVFFFFCGSCGSSVSTVTRLQIGQSVDSWQRKRSSPSKHLGCTWGQPRFLFGGFWVFFPYGCGGERMKLNTHLFLMERLRV
jgi:hypothetical protein